MAMMKSMIKLSHPPDASAYGTDNIPTPKNKDKKFNKEQIVQSANENVILFVFMSKNIVIF